MNIVSIANILLYVPFLVLLTVLGVKYIAAGYRKGMIRSLISLAATAVSVAVSIIVVRHCNGFLRDQVLSWRPIAAFREMGALAELIKTGIQSILKVVLTFVVFGVVLVVCFVVLKWIVKLLTPGSVQSEQPGKAGARLLGMGIGALDALLATFVLLLPLYGMLAFAVPPVARVVSTEKANEGTGVLQTVQQHPMVNLYSGSGANTIYRGINVFSIGGESADTEAFSVAVAGVMDYVEALRSPDGESNGKLAEGLVSFLQESVTEGDLSYDAVNDLCGELENSTDGELESIFRDATIAEAFQESDNGLLEFVGDMLGGGLSFGLTP